MPKYSDLSKERLETCHPSLILLFNTVIKGWDCTILCGHRTKGEQDRLFDSGRSKLRYPYSKHNQFPSQAVDVSPHPIDWNDLGSFYMFAGYVIRISESLGIRIRYGGDWDGDKKTADQTFNDLPHYELLIL